MKKKLGFGQGTKIKKNSQLKYETKYNMKFFMFQSKIYARMDIRKSVI